MLTDGGDDDGDDNADDILVPRGKCHLYTVN